MKARKVTGLDPQGPLDDNLAEIITVRLDELTGFMPAAVTDQQALHDMRIAAKRLRYVLEVAHPCFGPYAKTAVKRLREMQDVLGEIHDADEHLPTVAALLDEVIGAGADAAQGDPSRLARAPDHRAYAGLVALQVHLRGRRAALHREFLELWQDLERKGFRARLKFALTERSQPIHGEDDGDAMMAESP